MDKHASKRYIYNNDINNNNSNTEKVREQIREYRRVLLF